MQKPTKNLLLLGEPDYIDLYLKHFPIITSPYLTQSTPEEIEMLKSLQESKEVIEEKKETYRAQIGLETIPEDTQEDDGYTQDLTQKNLKTKSVR